jgi:hypothetical protein
MGTLKSDLSISVLVLVLFSAGYISIASAEPGRFYVVGQNYNNARLYRGVRGYQNTVSVFLYDSSGVASFVILGQENGNFMSIGFAQGSQPDGSFESNPVYFVDRFLNLVYKFWKLEQAPVGQNHRYWVCLIRLSRKMVTYIDATERISETGYLNRDCTAEAQTESHDTRNQMNHHFWYMQAQTIEQRWFLWHDTFFHADSPYHYTTTSAYEWLAHGQG